MSSELDQDLAHLIGAIDVVDRCLDELPTIENRQAFTDSVLGFLKFETEDLTHDSVELFTRLRCLRELIKRLGIHEEFCLRIATIFEQTELKRQAKDSKSMIAHLVAEWRAAGHLPVLVLGKESNPRFEKFFFLCCEMMSSIDMMQDAKIDYAEGQISIRPGLMLYLRLLGNLMLPMPRLFVRFPIRLSLFKYGISFLLFGSPDCED